MTKAQEIVLKIGEYIQEKDGKITFSEILEEYTKLPAPERTMVELMVEEHNKRYKERKTVREGGLDFLHPNSYTE